MSRSVLILRPQPGADATAQRARGRGLDPVVAPLFSIAPLAWDAPDPALFDAVLLTSANGARHGGSDYLHLPCYAVGEATAAAARAAGYGEVRVGPSDAAAAAAMMARDGIGRALHLCGRDRVAASAPGLRLEARMVYAAEPVAALPEAAREAVAAGATALLHSERAARHFAVLAGDRERVRIAAISASVAEAAGTGWALKGVASAPRDEALLELAVQLCQTDGDLGRVNGG